MFIHKSRALGGGGIYVKKSNIIMIVAKIMDEIRGMNYPDFVYCICSK